MRMEILLENKPDIKKKDIVFIIALIAVGVVMSAFLLLTKTYDKNGVCIVKSDGEIKYKLPLSEDITIDIEGENGAYNTLVIKSGRACVIDASCKDKLCHKMGNIKYDGQSIICLPNKLVISVESTNVNLLQPDASTW